MCLVKKIIIILLMFCVVSSYAGGDLPEEAANQLPQDAPDDGPAWIFSGAYVTAAYGVAIMNWAKYERRIFVSFRSRGRSGHAFGFTMGYRFYPFFELEGGFFKMPTVNGVGHTNADPTFRIEKIGVVTWFGYVAGKFLIRLFGHVYLDVGTGVTYRRTEPKPSELFSNARAYNYTFLMTGGLEWYIGQNWEIYTSYFFVPGYNRDIGLQPTKRFNNPPIHLFVAGLGYKFSI
jgi:opacity protein-like surface antigen